MKILSVVENGGAVEFNPEPKITASYGSNPNSLGECDQRFTADVTLEDGRVVHIFVQGKCSRGVCPVVMVDVDHKTIFQRWLKPEEEHALGGA